MRKLIFLLLFVLAVMPFRTLANVNIFISDETLWSEFSSLYNYLRADCPPGTAPNNFSVYGTGGTFFATLGNLTCDNCVLGDCSYGQPWSGRYNGGSGTSGGSSPDPLPAPPLPNPSVEFYEEIDFSGVLGFDSEHITNSSDGTMWIYDTERPDWQDAHYDVLNDYTIFNNFMRLNLTAQAGYAASIGALSTNITGRRIANLQQKIDESNFMDWENHQNTVARLDRSIWDNYAMTVGAVTDSVYGTTNTILDGLGGLSGQNQSLSGAISGLQQTLDHMYPQWSQTGDGLASDVHEQLLSEFDNLLYDLTEEIQTNSGGGGPVTLNSVGYLSDGQTLRRIDQKTDFMEANLNNAIYSATSNVSSNVDWARQNVIYNTEQQTGQILDAIGALEGSGGGISEEFASGLVGDYTGDDYNDSEAEGLLGTEGLTIDDLDGETVSLDSVSENFFSFAPVQCFEPLTLNFSVFGAENIIEIDLTPLCTLFNLVGALLFIASNLLAVRVVVGAF